MAGAQDDTNLRQRGGKVYKEKRKLPPIGDLLAYGAPESEGKEKTWLDVIAGPAALAVVFFISFLIFINAPHHLSKAKDNPVFAMNDKPHQKKTKPPSWDEFKVERDPVTGDKPKFEPKDE